MKDSTCLELEIDLTFFVQRLLKRVSLVTVATLSPCTGKDLQPASLSYQTPFDKTINTMGSLLV